MKPLKTTHRLLTLVILLSIPAFVQAQTGAANGHDHDIWVVNFDNSVHDSRLRLQTNDNAFVIQNSNVANELRFSFSNGTNHTTTGSALAVMKNNGDFYFKRIFHHGGGDLYIGNTIRAEEGILMPGNQYIQSFGSINFQADNNNSGDGTMHFRAGPDIRMTLTDAGRLGIGTDTPTEYLEMYPNQDESAVIGKAHIGNMGHADWAGFSHTQQNGTTSYALLQHADGNTFLNAPSGSQIRFNINNNARMVLDPNGKLGIGTTTPLNALDIEGGSVIGAGYSGTSTAPANGLLIQGQVGIGLTSPNAELAVKGTVRGAFDDNQTEFVEIAHGGVNGVINTVGDGNLDFQHDDDTKMSLTEDGRLGIGTDTPLNTLDIEGGSVIGAGYSGTSTAPANGLLIQGYVGIGTIAPQSELSVDGKITAREVEVTSNGWADFVFAEDYKLRNLEEVEAHIQANKHLPDVPSEKEIMENGINLGDMDAILLRKIEELTLYVIDLQKQNDALKAEVRELK